jgi:hypothetical protein
MGVECFLIGTQLQQQQLWIRSTVGIMLFNEDESIAEIIQRTIACHWHNLDKKYLSALDQTKN